MNRWVHTNTNISRTLDEFSLAHVTAFYDELCIQPDLHLRNIVSGYIGMPFESGALDYWKKEHHGLGGNGAAFNNLRQHPHAKVTTGDDEYYATHAAERFYDSRWIDELGHAERLAIEDMRIVKEYLGQHARDFSHFDLLLRESADC